MLAACTWGLLEKRQQIQLAKCPVFVLTCHQSRQFQTSRDHRSIFGTAHASITQIVDKIALASVTASLGFS